MTTLRFGWRDDKPATGQVVEVWYNNAIHKAVWTGQRWESEAGQEMIWISHWRAAQDKAEK